MEHLRSTAPLLCAPATPPPGRRFGEAVRQLPRRSPGRTCPRPVFASTGLYLAPARAAPRVGGNGKSDIRGNSKSDSFGLSIPGHPPRCCGAVTTTGPCPVRLGEAARTVVEALPGPRDPDAYLFSRNAGRNSPTNIVAGWRAVCEHAGLGRLRLHDLRHTTASHAVMSGETLPLSLIHI